MNTPDSSHRSETCATDPLLTLREVADERRTSIDAVRGWIAKGVRVGYRSGMEPIRLEAEANPHRIFVRRSALNRFLEALARARGFVKNGSAAAATTPAPTPQRLAPVYPAVRGAKRKAGVA